MDDKPKQTLSFLLSEAQPGDSIWVVDVLAQGGALNRLVGMGLTRGAQLVVTNRAGGLLMVAQGNTRFGLNAQAARQILVQHSVTSTFQESAIQESAIQESAIQEKAIQEKAIQESTIHENTIQENAIQERPMETPRAQKQAQKTEQTAHTYLRDLAVGSHGRIIGYEQGVKSYRQKLLAMGLTPGTEFTITRQAPLGDPIELQVRGFQLSLR
ncbi:MAG: ferrous iron transport protein A [Phormidesmis sp.]